MMVDLAEKFIIKKLKNDYILLILLLLALTENQGNL
jgi:hypothetical protein